MSNEMNSPDPKSRLDELRERISRLDGELLDLVRKRMEAAAEVGEIKSSSEIPIRNYSVEARVLDRMRKGCEERGIDLELGQELLAHHNNWFLAGILRTNKCKNLPGGFSAVMAKLFGDRRRGNTEYLEPLHLSSCSASNRQGRFVEILTEGGRSITRSP